MKAPSMGDVLLREQELDLLEALAEAGDRLVRRDAEPAELVRQEGASKPDIESPAGDCIEHADLAGKLERVVEHRQHRAGHQPGAPRALGGGAEKHDRVGAVAAVGLEIVLDRADMREPQPIPLLRNIEAVAEVIAARLLLRRYIGKELQAELHGALAGQLAGLSPRHDWNEHAQADAD